MAEIKIIDLGHVAIDGKIAGSVLDVAANYAQIEGIKGLVLAALQEWVSDRQTAHEAALAGAHENHAKVLAGARAAHTAALQAAHSAHGQAIDAARQAHDAALSAQADKHAESLTDIKTSLQARHAAECQGLRDQLADLRTQLAAKDSLIAALGGTELGQRMAREAAIRAAEDAVVKANAALTALKGR